MEQANEQPEQLTPERVMAGFTDVEVAAAYAGIRTESLRKWTDSGHAPHHFVDGTGPWFKGPEVKKWARENLVEQRGGLPIPTRLEVFTPVSVLSKAAPPIAIAGLQTLCHLAITGGSPGIYFLCKGNEVVYVGQSVCVVARIAQHIGQKCKDFDLDRVYYLPCPVTDLDVVERNFIDMLKPRYNGDTTGEGRRWLSRTGTEARP